MKRAPLFAVLAAGLLMLLGLNAANTPATAGNASLRAEVEGAACDLSCEPCPNPCPSPCSVDGAETVAACAMSQ